MSYNKTKTDPELGQKVHEHLVKMGVETPMANNPMSQMDRKSKIAVLELKFKEILEILGLDLTDDSLNETPLRISKMYVNEIFWGLDYDAFPKCTTVNNKMKYNEMVVERNVSVQSNCEHHFVIIDGLATVAYVPKDRVLGLSKIIRIVTGKHLRGAASSTRGPKWTYLWCSGCHASGIAGQLCTEGLS